MPHNPLTNTCYVCLVFKFQRVLLKELYTIYKIQLLVQLLFFLENKLTPLEGLKGKLAFILIWFLSIMYEHWADLPGLPMKTDRPEALIYFPWRNIFVLRGKEKKKKKAHIKICADFSKLLGNMPRWSNQILRMLTLAVSL